jgi:hypothetical protein
MIRKKRDAPKPCTGRGNCFKRYGKREKREEQKRGNPWAGGPGKIALYTMGKTAEKQEGERKA